MCLCELVETSADRLTCTSQPVRAYLLLNVFFKCTGGKRQSEREKSRCKKGEDNGEKWKAV